MPPPRILVFDVNETLLDLAALDEAFETVFGDRSVRHAWFRELLHQALVTTVTGPYVDFGTLARSALEVTATRHGRPVTEGEAALILDATRHLPPHDDVEEALDLLAGEGFRLVALSNGTPDALAAQLDHAGLTPRFDLVVSAEHAGRLKPAPEPYRWLAGELAVPPENLRMIAAHAWDTTGALRAGCAAAFVHRSGKHLSPVDPAPDIVGRSLVDVARAIREQAA